MTANGRRCDTGAQQRLTFSRVARILLTIVLQGGVVGCGAEVARCPNY
jgi:hypothetical protein